MTADTQGPITWTQWLAEKREQAQRIATDYATAAHTLSTPPEPHRLTTAAVDGGSDPVNQATDGPA